MQFVGCTVALYRGVKFGKLGECCALVVDISARWFESAPRLHKFLKKGEKKATAATIWTVVGEFITNFFSNGGTVLSSVLANTTLATMVVGIPVFGWLCAKILKMAHLKGRRR